MLETLENKVEHVPSSVKVNGVYLIYQKDSRRVYIGSSNQPGLRAVRHMTLLKSRKHYNPTFQELFDDNPEFYTVFYLVSTRDEAYALEQALVNYYLPTGLLINHGVIDVRAPNKGVIATAETREKQRLAKVGFTHTAEAREKIRLAGIGRVKSEEEKAKLSALKKGKPVPDHVAEMCRERNRLRSKPVSIDGVVYPSIREASRALDVKRDNVKTRLRTADPKWVNWFFVD